MPTGSKIRKIRQQKGLTQKQLGDQCGMADSAIRRYENGKAKPKIETLQKIADALNVSKSATTSSTGGLVLALKRTFLLLAQKGGIASTFTGPL